MKSNKDKWIEAVIASGQDVQKMRAPEHLYANIKQQLESKQTVISFHQFRIMLAAASVFALVNIAVLFFANKQSPQPPLAAYSVDTYNLDIY